MHAREATARWPQPLALILFSLAGLCIAVVLSRANFLLFHGLAEGVSIVVACSLVLIAWNARQFLDNDFLLFLGIACLFVGLIDLLHTFTYKGMGIFAPDSGNHATQLWISGRYLQSLSLLIAPFFFTRRINPHYPFWMFGLLTSALLASIFWWNIFPTCFVDGVGLTPFKTWSEYLVILLLAGAMAHLLARRRFLETQTLQLVTVAIGFCILSELAFTSYIDLYGMANMGGHVFKIIAFILFYNAIVISAIRRPQNLLYMGLKESAERYRQIFEGNTAIKLLIDPQNAQIIDANEAACRFYHYPREELLQKSIAELNVMPVEEIHEKMEQAVIRESSYFTFKHRLATGEVRDVEVYTGPITVDGKVMLFSIVHDISARKRAEERLHINEKRLNLLLHFTNLAEGASEEEIVNRALEEAVAITGSRIGYFHYICNDQVSLQLFTWSREVMAQCTAGTDRKYPLEQAGIWADCVRQRAPVIHNDYLNTPERKGVPEGHIPIQRHMSVPIFSGDKMIAIIGVGNKETDYKHEDAEQLTLLAQGVWRVIERIRTAEEHRVLETQLRQAQKMEAIGTLAGGIAHDFNNLLAIIFGYSEMARRELEPGSKAAKALDRIRVTSDRAKNLVGQILSFSRQSDISVNYFQPGLIVKEALKLLRPAFPQTIRINTRIEEDAGYLNADPTQYHQVLMNLCTNALHAMEKEGGDLDIELKQLYLDEKALQYDPDLTPGEYIRLTVSDTGAGIPEELRNKIFEPYFTTKEVGKGTGMGLSIVHGIVKRNYGGIHLESTAGQGARFHVDLPLARGKYEAEVEVPAEEEGGKGRILLVEDEEFLAEATGDTLVSLGYDVQVETDSVRALSVFRAEPEAFDLLLTDQTMPQLTGIELASHILKIRPELPIILVTGYSAMVSLELVEKIGIRELCFKPMRTEELSRLLRMHLEDTQPVQA